MRAEVVAVGSELLLGEVVDTNSPWISARLAEVGVEVVRHTAVGDEVARIVGVLRASTAACDVVVVSGGLGPTHDDLTRLAVARLCDVGLVRDPALVSWIEAAFARRDRAMPAVNLVQADLPEGARALAPVGTAAGFAVELDGCAVYCVPGVPLEMQAMLARDVVPDLVARGGLAVTVSRVVRTAGTAESSVAESLEPLVARLGGQGRFAPSVSLLAGQGEVRVGVTARAASREAALAAVDPAVDEAVAALGDAVVGLDDEGAEHAVARQLQRRGWTVATAESITAGGLGARLVRVPGASSWLRGGLLVYATDLKASLGGVDPDLLDARGPVSEEVAADLAAGAAARCGASVGVSVVGVAGPDEQGGRVVGTVVVGLALPGGEASASTTVVPALGREQVQAWAASTALDVLRRALAAAG